TDYVAALLEDGRRRAAANGLSISFEDADAEALPFDAGSFDVVLSSFGVMFTPDHERAASELARVCRPGGRIGLAAWTARGFIGRLFATVGTYAPPSSVASPVRWGSREYLERLFAPLAADIHTAAREFVFRYRSTEHWIDVFRRWYGPVHNAFAALAPEAQ